MSAFVVSCEVEVPDEEVELFATDTYNSTVTAGIAWSGVRQFVMGSEQDVQDRARAMAAAWLAVAAASEDRVSERAQMLARAEEYRRAKQACWLCGRDTSAMEYTRVSLADGSVGRQCSICNDRSAR